jgi:hypothetical protein
MSATLPSPSTRLLRAASAEQSDLARHRERLLGERARVLDELRRIDEAVAAADQRLEVLAQLVGPPEPATPAAAQTSPPDEPSAPAGGEDAGPLLRGPAVREAAVRTLIAQPGPIQALHYRRWYELVVDAGYQVAGKDPLAVFLTQLTRSPVVRKASAPGVYEVDTQAPARIRARLERLQAELREVTTCQRGPVELADIRARRHELDLAISEQERALEEALRVLRTPDQAVVQPLGTRSPTLGSSGARRTTIASSPKTARTSTRPPRAST